MESENNKDLTTREKLIATASEIFAEIGYDAATTRMITKKAGVLLSAIPYHFETKEKLYQVVIERAAEHVVEYFKPIPEQVKKDSDEGRLDRDTAKAYLKRMLEKQIDWALGQGLDYVYKLILRVHSNQLTASTDIINEVLFEQVIKTFVLLVMAITGKNDLEWATIFSCALNGEMIFFCDHRGFVAKFLNYEGYSIKEADRIREIVIKKIMDGVEASIEL